MHSHIFTLDQVREDLVLNKQLYLYMTSKSREMGQAFEGDTQENLTKWKSLTSEYWANTGVKNLNKWWVVVFDDDKNVIGFKILRAFGGESASSWVIAAVNFHNTQAMLDWTNPHPWKVALDATARLMKEHYVYDLYSYQADRPAHRKLWRTGRDALKYCEEWYDQEKQQYKWHIFNEGLLPANTPHPNTNIFHNVMMRTTLPMPVTVRRFTLKNEYRPGWEEVENWWIREPNTK